MIPVSYDVGPLEYNALKLVIQRTTLAGHFVTERIR